MTTFRMLFDEYRAQLIGPLIYDLVGQLARAKARRYPERLYNGGMPWDDDSLSALHHDVITLQLLEKAQIHFVFAEPDPVTDELGYQGVCKRLNFVIRRVLVQRLRDAGELEIRLIGRVRKLARAGLVEAVPLGRTRYYRLPGSTHEYRALSDGEVTSCADLVKDLPRLVSRPESQRRSMGYRSKDLRTAVTIILADVGAISEDDLGRIFGTLFTPFGSSALDLLEEEHAMLTDPVTETDLADMTASVGQYVATLAPKELLLVVGKSQGLSDETLRESVGASRPTLQKMRERVAAGLRSSVLDSIDPDLLDDALDEFAWQCSERLQAGTA